MRKLDDVLRAVAASDTVEVLAPHWEESEASYPEPWPPFLAPEAVAAERAYAGLPAEGDAILLEAARRVRDHPALAHLAWHCSRLVYEHRDYPAGHIGQWPLLEQPLGELCGVFYQLIALAALPQMRAAHRARGVPESVSRETCGHFPASLAYYQMHHGGRWGYLPRVLYWLRNHTAGELYRLGRMEYMVRPAFSRVHAFRHRATGRVLALSVDGVRLNPQGFIESPADEASGWAARLVEDDMAWLGCPILPTGVAVQREVRLPKDQWRRELQPGDWVLEMHIPGGGGMTLDRCRESMARALAFFPQFFPERPFAGFDCGSWILNPELETIYSPESNMVLWQRELYLYPWPTGGHSGLYFLFGRDDIDPATAPRDTSLRRAALEHMERGGKLRAGGMFLLTPDFARFGSQVYRSMVTEQLLDEFAA